MAVKITQTGIDTLQDNIVSTQKIIDNSINYEDLPSGSVVQVINTVYYTQTSFTTTTSDQVVPGLTLDITPKLSGSKFLIFVRIFVEVDGAWDVVFNVQRNGSRINTESGNYWDGLTMPTQTYGAATNNDSTPEMVDICTLDITGSTAGQTITYRAVSSAGSSRTCMINRCFGSDECGTSELIIMEIKG